MGTVSATQEKDFSQIGLQSVSQVTSFVVSMTLVSAVLTAGTEQPKSSSVGSMVVPTIPPPSTPAVGAPHLQQVLYFQTVVPVSAAGA